jgi:hypothetical protein
MHNSWWSEINDCNNVRLWFCIPSQKIMLIQFKWTHEFQNWDSFGTKSHIINPWYFVNHNLSETDILRYPSNYKLEPVINVGLLLLSNGP